VSVLGDPLHRADRSRFRFREQSDDEPLPES
jgi:hypothetical protein